MQISDDMSVQPDRHCVGVMRVVGFGNEHRCCRLLRALTRNGYPERLLHLVAAEVRARDFDRCAARDLEGLQHWEPRSRTAGAWVFNESPEFPITDIRMNLAQET